MKTLLLVLGFLLFGNTIEAQISYRQYFDGLDTSASNSIFVELDTSASNVWQIGKPSKTIFTSAATIPNAIVTDTNNNYPPNITSSFRISLTKVISSGSLMAVRWKQKLDFEQHRDGGIVEFSKNGGAWENIFNNPKVYRLYGFNQANKDTLPDGSVAFSGTDTMWRDVWLCYSGFRNTDTLDIRFTIKTDSANNQEGWMIDNLMAQRTYVHTVPKVESQEKVRVFPTFTTGILHVEADHLLQKQTIISLTIVNADGKIMRAFNNDLQDRFLLDIGQFPAGDYIVTAVTNLGKTVHKIVLSHN